MFHSITAPQSLSELADTELIELTRGGDVLAYGEIWRRHNNAAGAIARRVTTRIDSDDLVSEAFARVLQAIRNGAGPTIAVRGYLATTIRSVAASWGQSLPQDVALEGVPEQGFIDERLERVDDLDMAAQAGRVFKTLPERWQTALWYSEVESLSNSEIGAILSLKPSAAAMLASRARTGLRKAWAEATTSERIKECV